MRGKIVPQHNLKIFITIYVYRTNKNVILCQNVMTQVMEEIAAIGVVTVNMEFLVTKKQDNVPRGVHLAMKESTVTKVNSKISWWIRVYLTNSEEFVQFYKCNKNVFEQSIVFYLNAQIKEIHVFFYLLVACGHTYYGQGCNMTCSTSCFNQTCDAKTGACLKVTLLKSMILFDYDIQSVFYFYM